MEDKKTILVTGASGFIGTNFIEKLVGEGHEVVALIRDSDGAREKMQRLRKLGTPEQLKIVKGDITNENSLKPIFQKHDISDVIHLAAQPHAGKAEQELAEYNEDNAPTMRINRDGTKTLAELANADAMGKGKVTGFYYVSSSNVFDASREEAKRDEDSEKNPSNFYGRTKLAGEKALEGKEHLSSTVVYPPNHIGKHQKTIAFAPMLISKLLNGESVNITGNEEQEVEFLTVGSHADTMLKVLEASKTAGGIEHYCIPGDDVITLGQLSHDICGMLDTKAATGEIEYPENVDSFGELVDRENAQSFTPTKLQVMDGAKIKQNLGHEADAEKFPETLKDVVDFYVEQHNATKVDQRINQTRVSGFGR